MTSAKNRRTTALFSSGTDGDMGASSCDILRRSPLPPHGPHLGSLTPRPRVAHAAAPARVCAGGLPAGWPPRRQSFQICHATYVLGNSLALRMDGHGREVPSSTVH